jgi:hypothetical protein
MKMFETPYVVCYAEKKFRGRKVVLFSRDSLPPGDRCLKRKNENFSRRVAEFAENKKIQIVFRAFLCDYP